MVKAGADESKIKIIGVFFSVVVEAGVPCLKVHIYDIDKLLSNFAFLVKVELGESRSS